MLTVACVLSEGPIYNRSHVDRLEKMVAQHLKQPYQFVCVDDSPLPGFWAKIDLFKPGRFTGRVLYLDLDTTVVGKLDDLANYQAPFAAIRDYQYPLQINSSVMSWDAGVADQVYTDFTPEVMNRLHGDQNWIHEKVNPARFPLTWCVSYKAHVLPLRSQFRLPTASRVIVYHGKPKPWDLSDDHLSTKYAHAT